MWSSFPRAARPPQGAHLMRMDAEVESARLRDLHPEGTIRLDAVNGDASRDVVRSHGQRAAGIDTDMQWAGGQWRRYAMPMQRSVTVDEEGTCVVSIAGRALPTIAGRDVPILL